MPDFDKDDYLSDADDLNRLSHQDGPKGSDADAKADAQAASSAAGARADSGATAASASTSAGSTADHDGSVPVSGDDSGSSAAAAPDATARAPKGSDTKKPDAAGASDAGKLGSKAAGSTAKGDGSLTELGKAKKEAADYLEALQRERADFVNYRHRTAREKDDYRRRGQEDVLRALLPALDNLDRLREHNKMTPEVEAIARQLDHGFDTFHITKFGAKGEAFDPARHEAILHRTSPDVDSVQIDTVVEAGYELGGRILRAAKVVVVSPEEKPAHGANAGAKTSDQEGPSGKDSGSSSDGSASSASEGSSAASAQ